MDILSNTEPLSETVVLINPERVEQAMHLAQSRTNATQQWQTYLNALALFGFEQWLSQRDSSIQLERDHSSRLQPAIEPSVATTVQANGFRLCLIPAQPDEVIDVPQALVQMADRVAHLYVAITVYEESAQVEIAGFIRYDQLVDQIASLTVDEDLSYPVPFAWFDPDPDHLLLYLRCSEPAAIALPEAVGDRSDSIIQTAMNVGLWLKNQLDGLAEDLSWILLPAPALATEMRSTGVGMQRAQPDGVRLPVNELFMLLRQLERDGLQLPAQRASGYRDWEMANMPLRLYVVTGAVPDDSSDEWMLLLILGSQTGVALPQGLSMRVSSGDQVIVEQTVAAQTDGDYLIAQVVGDWDEQFSAAIALPNGIVLTLPPFAFQPR